MIRRRHNGTTVTRALLVALLAAMLGSGVTSAATPLPGSFLGDAYGTYANATAGKLATTLGRSAYIVCGCLGTGGVTNTNTVNTVDAGDAFRAEKIFTTTYATKSTTRATVKDTAKVTGVRALNSLVTADAIDAVANTTATATNMYSSDTGSTFLNLRIAGRSISATVAPNTRVDLPGFGRVILREVVRSGDQTSRSVITVNMMHIFITRTNTLNIPVGSEIVVAHASSGYLRSQPPAFYTGQAHAFSAYSSAVIENRVGRAAAIYLGCAGTGGVTRTNNVNVTDAPGVGSFGSGVTTAFGGQTSTGPRARTSARVESVNLLSGMITADAVTGVALSAVGANGGGYSNYGSGFVNLVVLGRPVSVTVAPNTRVELPGIGYAILYETSNARAATGARSGVTMIRVYVTTANALGLPINTQIAVAIAFSSVRAN